MHTVKRFIQYLPFVGLILVITACGGGGGSGNGSNPTGNITDSLLGIGTSDHQGAYAINKTTAVAQRLTDQQTQDYNRVFDLTYIAATNKYYFIDGNLGYLFSVDANTFIKTQIGTVAINYGSSSGMAYHAASGLLYVAGSTGLYTVNPATAKTHYIGDWPVGIYVNGLAFDSSGTTLYGIVGNYLYSINPSTAAANKLVKIGNYGYSSYMFGLFCDPTTNKIYTHIRESGSGYNLIEINPTTGSTQFAAYLGEKVSAYAFNSTANKIVVLSGNNFYSVDYNSPSPSIASFRSVYNVQDAAFDEDDGYEYAIDTASHDLLVIDPENLKLVQVVALENLNLKTISYDNVNHVFYGTAGNELVNIDVTTGSTTSVVTLNNQTNYSFREFTSISYNPANNLLYAVDGTYGQQRLWTLDPATGAVNVVGNTAQTVNRYYAIAFNKTSGVLYGLDYAHKKIATIDTSTASDLAIADVTSASTTDGIIVNDNLTTPAIYHITQELISKIDTGSLTESSSGSPATHFSDLAYDPASDMIYSYDSTSKHIITLNPATGVITQLPTAPGNIGSLAYDTNHGILYGTDNSGNIVSIDTTTGAATVVLNVTFYVSSINYLTYDPDLDVFYGIYSNDSLIKIDLNATTNQVTFIASIGRAIDHISLAYNTDDKNLYGVDSTTNELLLINQTSAVATTVSDLDGYQSSPSYTISGLVYRNSNAATHALLGISKPTYRSGLYYDNLMTLPTDGSSFGLKTIIGQLTKFTNYTFVGYTYDVNTKTLYAVDTLNNLVKLDYITNTAMTIGQSSDVSAYGDIAYDSNNNTLYGLDKGKGNLVSINTSDGASTTIGTVGGFQFTQGLTYDPVSDKLYSVASGSTLISIDPATGQAATVSSTNHLASASYTGLAFDTMDNQVYAIDNRGTLYTVATDTGLSSSVGTSGYNSVGLAYIADTGKLYTTGQYNGRPIEVNPNNGLATSIDDVGLPLISATLNTDDGIIYGSNDAGLLVSLDPKTGTTTEIADYKFDPIAGFAYDNNNKTMYISLYSELDILDLSTGAMTSVGQFTDGSVGYSNVADLAYNQKTNTLYGLDYSSFNENYSDKFLKIDITTGQILSSTTLSNKLMSLVYDTKTESLYGSTVDATLVSVDPDTGNLTTIGDLIAPMDILTQASTN